MRADPALTAHTAGVMLDGATALAAAGRPLASTLDVKAEAFGPLGASSGVGGAYRRSVDELEVLLGRLGQVLECDSDRLYQLAFAYGAAENRAAQRLGYAGRRARGELARWGRAAV
jgi:hypothetical protein